MVLKIVSGGQTGVDRAALDAALSRSMVCGGWCPAGRRAEDGEIAPCYSLIETPSKNYARRTEWNVRDSDATLIVVEGEPTGGTALTIQFTEKYAKPYMIVDLDKLPTTDGLTEWIRVNDIQTLNVAGPRESTTPGIYRRAYDFLESWFASV